MCGRLIDRLRARGRRIIVLSEYGLTNVTRPVHINRALREAGLLAVRDELGTDALDAGASEAFAVADHQVAHVYVRESGAHCRSQSNRGAAAGRRRGARSRGACARRASITSAPASSWRSPPRTAWFTYYYWLDDARAPDFARTVDIHRKPGYDPAELFLDPAIPMPKLKIGYTLAKKALGFRYLMEVIPLDATLVRGSHGRVTDKLDDGPVFYNPKTAGPGEAGGGAVGDPVPFQLFRWGPGHGALGHQNSRKSRRPKAPHPTPPPPPRKKKKKKKTP